MSTHFALAHIRSAVSPIDSTLKTLRGEISSHPDPDTFGLIDSYEQFVGIGFTVCQTFLSLVHKGENKNTSIQTGPFYSDSEKSYAQITNACANYWKHNYEWDKDNLSNQSKKTIETFDRLDVDVWAAYPLTEMFEALFSENGSFDELLSHLNEWAIQTSREF